MRPTLEKISRGPSSDKLDAARYPANMATMGRDSRERTVIFAAGEA